MIINNVLGGVRYLIKLRNNKGFWVLPCEEKPFRKPFFSGVNICPKIAFFHKKI